MHDGQGILIIDDDVDYCCLLQLAFHEVDVLSPVEAVHDGRAAIEHLLQISTGIGGVMPGLVLLDLRMPGLSGIEVLRWMRGQPFLASVPIVVFTGLEGGRELAQAAALGASAVHLKPFSYRELMHEAKELRDTYVLPGHLQVAA